MNASIKCLVNTITILGLSVAVNTHVQSAELEVSLDQINSDKGKVYAQIFAGKEQYKSNQAHQSIMIVAQKGVNKLSFKGLVEGEYVVQIYHDENDNRKMDRNAFGMPTEGYGFSNEAVGSMGPPTYEQMKVIIDEDKVVKTTAKMIYL